MEKRKDNIDHQDTAPRRKARDLRQRLASATAELGWQRAQFTKKVQRLESQLWKSDEDRQSLKLEIDRLRGKLVERRRSKAVLKHQFKELRQSQRKYADRNSHLEKVTMETYSKVLDLCKQQASSRMAAAICDDEPIEDLLVTLQRSLKTFREKASRDAKKRYEGNMQNLQEQLDSERQYGFELLYALDGYKEAQSPRLEVLEHQLTGVCEAISRTSTICARMDEPHTKQSSSCGHPELGPTSLTGCNVLLCKKCDGKIRDEIIAGSSILRCFWCRDVCLVVSLPRLLTLPWMLEWKKVVDQGEIAQRLL